MLAKWVNTIFFIFFISLLAIAQTTKEQRTPYLSQILFLSANQGFIVGYINGTGIILSSTDGGNHWQEQYKTKAGISKIQFIEDKIGWAIGHFGTILNTKDGGQTWQEQLSGTKEHLYSLYIADKNSIFVIGDNGILLTTNDQGQSWIIHKLNTDVPLQDIKFVDQNTGYITGASNLFYTNDSGKTWTQKSINDINFMSSIIFVDKDNILINADPFILKTFDGGKDWQKIQLSQPGYISKCVFVDLQHGWLAKADGTEGSIVHIKGVKDQQSFSYILSTSDGGISWEETLSISSQKTLGAWILDIFFLDRLKGWAVGKDGLLLLTIDGGQTWARKAIYVNTDGLEIKDHLLNND